MLIFQLVLLVTAMFVLSILVYQHTRNRAWALSTYMILLLPNIVNIAGVIWKDVIQSDVGGNAHLVHYKQ